MSVPRPDREGALGMLAQIGHDGRRAHGRAYSQRFFIDDVIPCRRATFEKVETALRAGRAEPGELGVADLGAEAVLGFVAARCRRPLSTLRSLSRPQHAAGFVQEALLAGNQQRTICPWR